MEFAVHIEGVHETDVATWVLAVDGDRLLVAYEDKTLHWHDLSECTFAKGATPEVARPVVVVQPQRPELVTPNRVLRRQINGN